MALAHLAFTEGNFPFSLGVEVAIAKGAFVGYTRVGMVTNNAAKTSSGKLTRLLLLEAGLPLVRLFSPEHGITTTGADGASQEDTQDEITGLPVISLYRDHPAPETSLLEDLDLLIFDVPDVGARFYTYLWTLSYVMQSCEKTGITLMVMDRPNPISALTAHSEGPFLDEQHCSSFIGRWNIPLKHGCTLGELANFFHHTRMPDLRLIICTMQGYERYFRAGMHYPFQPTSPALFRWQAVVLYPGTCLLEGLNLNEGRGTTTPFECFGAPWLDTDSFLASFPFADFPYLKMEAVQYTPTDSLFKGECCEGIYLHLTTAEVNDAVRLGLTLIATLFKTHREHLDKRAYKTLVNPTGGQHLDRLLGIHQVYEKLQQGMQLPIAIAEEWQTVINPYLLYPRSH